MKVKQHVTHWAVGMTTAPRAEPTLETSLRSLAQAGWEGPRLFVEPATFIPERFSDLPMTCHDKALGAWPNWYLGLVELSMRAPHAEAYLMCQDDVLFTRGLRNYLERTLWPAPEIGVVSVYCPSHEHRDGDARYEQIDPGWRAWGALAYVFSNPGVRTLLSDHFVVNHRHHGPADGARNVDSVVGGWCQRQELPYFVHTPSLAQHIGRTSTIWRRGGTTGRRRAKEFSEEGQMLKTERSNSGVSIET